MTQPTNRTFQSRRRAVQAPRSEPDYNSERDARGRGNEIPVDDRTLNTSLPNCPPLALFRPRREKSILMTRPLPMLSYKDPNGTLQLGRQNANDNAWTHWLVFVFAAKFIGPGKTKDGAESPQYTFLLYPPHTPADERHQHPYKAFYDACERANTSGRFGASRTAVWDVNWNWLLKKNLNGGTAISPPTGLWFYQAGVLRANQYDRQRKVGYDHTYLDSERSEFYGLAPSDPLVVVQLTRGGGQSVARMFNTHKDTFDEKLAAKDFSEPFLYGDPVGKFNKATGTVEGGWFFGHYHPDEFPEMKPPTSYSGQRANVPSFELCLRQAFAGKDKRVYKPSLSVSQTEQVFNRVQFWFPDAQTGAPGLLNFPSHQEVMFMIANAFRDYGKLVEYALGDFPELFTDDINGIIRRRQAVRPGGRQAPNNQTFAEDDVDAGVDDVAEAPARRPTRQRDVTQQQPMDDAADEPMDGMDDGAGDALAEEAYGDTVDPADVGDTDEVDALLAQNPEDEAPADETGDASLDVPEDGVGDDLGDGVGDDADLDADLDADIDADIDAGGEGDEALEPEVEPEPEPAPATPPRRPQRQAPATPSQDADLYSALDDEPEPVAPAAPPRRAAAASAASPAPRRTTTAASDPAAATREQATQQRMAAAKQQASRTGRSGPATGAAPPTGKLPPATTARPAGAAKPAAGAAKPATPPARPAAAAKPPTKPAAVASQDKRKRTK